MKTLEELKAAWDAAEAKAKANPENAELKAAAESAKAAYDAKAAEEAETTDEDETDPDESSLDAKTKKYVEKLRKEAAKYRVDAKDSKSKLKAEEEKRKAILKAAGIETEEEDPAEKLKTATAETQNLNFRNAILESALEHGIAKDDLDYYEFLVTKEAGSLKDDEELSDEQMAEIVKKVKKSGKGGSGNTSVGNGKGGKTPNPDSGDQVTLDKFVKMTMSEKGQLYEANPELYKQLVGEAKTKNRLI